MSRAVPGAPGLVSFTRASGRWVRFALRNEPGKGKAARWGKPRPEPGARSPRWGRRRGPVPGSAPGAAATAPDGAAGSGRGNCSAPRGGARSAPQQFPQVVETATEKLGCSLQYAFLPPTAFWWWFEAFFFFFLRVTYIFLLMNTCSVN